MSYGNPNYRNGNGRQYPPRNNGYQQRGNSNGGYNNQQQQAPFDPELRGKCWQNTKATHPKAPHFTGTCQILGVEYRVSVWFAHEPGKGDVMTLKFQDKQEARRQQFQNGGGYSGYAQQPQGAGYSRHAPSGYATQPPQQPQQPAYAGNRGEDAPWPNDGAPPVTDPGAYGNDDPWGE